MGLNVTNHLLLYADELNHVHRKGTEADNEVGLEVTADKSK
jgi:hypothetical protein